MDIARELYREQDWEMPAGFLDAEDRDPFNYTGAEAGQAKRTAQDPKVLKALFQRCWSHSDSRASFAAALWAEGYCLARGERRGFVAVDADGKVWSLSRWCGVKTGDLHARLGDPRELLSPEEAVQLFQGLSSLSADRTNTAAPAPDPGFKARRQELITRQRREREALRGTQEQRRVREHQARQARLPRGLRALWLRVTGGEAKLLAELQRDADASAARDRDERQALIDRHLAARRSLAQQQPAADDLSRDLETVFREAAQTSTLRSDPRQWLILPKDDLPFSRAQLLRDPTLILTHLSHKQARFPEIEIKRALAAQIDEPLALRRAIDTVLASTELVRLENDACTTRDYQQAVAQLTVDVQQMANSGDFAVAPALVAAAMGEQDAKLAHRVGGQLSEEQRQALHHILGDRQLACVVGLAGSGKSTMLEMAQAAWAQQGRRVHGAALSGKAAAGLQSASGIESRTLASLETSWRNGQEPIARGDILVIDEAGMVSTRQMSRIAHKLRSLDAKLVLVGDPGQLQPIEAGTPFRQLIDAHGAARLSEIHRQRTDWQRQASRDLAEGDVEAYASHGAVNQTADADTALAALVEDYIADAESGDANVTRLAFAHRRRDVFALNQAIRQALRRGQPTPPAGASVRHRHRPARLRRRRSPGLHPQ